MNRALFFIFFVTACSLLPSAFKHFTCGVRVAKMELGYPYNPDFDLCPSASPEVRAILQQPFDYLGKGSQSFAFASRDGHYVLKIFRRPKNLQNVATGLFRSLRGTAIAYRLAAEETGLLYVHLNQTNQQLPTVKLKDPLRRSLYLKLDQYWFVLQKRSISLEEAFAQGPVQPRIDAFLALLSSRIAKGIGNSDANISRNFGFVGERALEFDCGNYDLSPDLCVPEQRDLEMRRYRTKLRVWLTRHAPEGVPSVVGLEESRGR